MGTGTAQIPPAPIPISPLHPPAPQGAEAELPGTILVSVFPHFSGFWLCCSSAGAQALWVLCCAVGQPGWAVGQSLVFIPDLAPPHFQNKALVQKASSAPTSPQQNISGIQTLLFSLPGSL